VLIEVDGLPNWYRSIRFREMGSKNGVWLRVVGFLCFLLGVGCVDASYLWEVKY